MSKTTALPFVVVNRRTGIALAALPCRATR